MRDPTDRVRVLEENAAIHGWPAGHDDAIEKLMPAVAGELGTLAERYLRSTGPGHSLQRAALLHEAFVRLVGCPDGDRRCRARFFAVAVRALRRVLVDRARGPMSLEDGSGCTVDVQVLNETLERFAENHPREAYVVELRCFGGLTYDEVAEILGVDRVRVEQEWSEGYQLLRRRLDLN